MARCLVVVSCQVALTAQVGMFLSVIRAGQVVADVKVAWVFQVVRAGPRCGQLARVILL